MIGDLVRADGVEFEVVFDGRQLLLGPYAIRQTGFSLKQFTRKRQRPFRPRRRKGARGRRAA